MFPEAFVECQFGAGKHWISGMNQGELGPAEVERVVEAEFEIVEIVEGAEVVEVVEVEVVEVVEVVAVTVIAVGIDELYYRLKRAMHSVYPWLLGLTDHLERPRKYCQGDDQVKELVWIEKGRLLSLGH